MVLMTMIARVADGLPLAASVQEEEQVCFRVLTKIYDNYGQEYFAECGLRNAECRPRVFCGMWDAEKNLRNEV